MEQPQYLHIAEGNRNRRFVRGHLVPIGGIHNNPDKSAVPKRRVLIVVKTLCQESRDLGTTTCGQ